MSLKKCILYSCALLIAGLLSVAPSNARYPTIVQSGCQPVTCPPCWQNESPMPGSGPAEDGSGRRTIIVFIDSTWGNPTNVNIRNAVEDAIGLWNVAQDTTCTPPAKTGYYLKLNQNAPAGSRDIEITKDDTISACAAAGSKISRERPDKLFLKSTAANLSRSKLAKLIAHEFGHSLGLDNSSVGSSCQSDIMGLVADRIECTISNVFDNYRITSSDVGQSNRHIIDSSRTTTCRGDRNDPANVPATEEECEAEGNHWNSSEGVCEEPPPPPVCSSGETNPHYECFYPGLGCVETPGCGQNTCDPNVNCGFCEGATHECPPGPFGWSNAMCCCLDGDNPTQCATSPIVLDILGNGFRLTDAINGTP